MVSDRKAYMKQWRLENKAKIIQTSKQYNLDNLKNITIKRWKKQGLNHDYEMVWNRLNNSTNCENPKCNVVYGKYNDGTGTHKCMDHDHTPGLENNFRNILCFRCNVNLRMDNTTGIPNICKTPNGWEYRRWSNGKRHTKFFKYYYDAVVYKYLFEYYYIYNVDN